MRQLNPMSRLLIVCLSASLAVGPALAQRQGMFPEPVAGDAHTGSPDLSGGGHSLPPTNGGGMAPSLNGGGMTPTIRSLDPRPAAQQPPQGPQPPEARQQTLPPNDFQRFVLETSGQALPLYGLTFFNQATATYVPQGNVPVSPDYRMGPGDEVQIRGWGSVDIDVRTTVDRDGLIHIPRVGKVNLSGIRSAQAEDVVRAAVGKYYKDFQLSVTLGQLKGITVYVVGQARKPGSYTLGSTSTLVSALFASGGPNQNGSMRRVQVKRGDKVVTELDLYAFLAKGEKAADIRLQDGDTIVIPPAKGFVALSGKVTNAAVFELAREGETLGAMLAVAGGLPVVADPKRAQLDR
ncbi:polysaccharide biosynthesis/export family protein, partial [uncultured Aquabacterium sp.]|uniref:polysaccharide biosynthesis/export family protein n=1 Tax=uncultured Aquabacterium sp. TaxID=158753 RepID=UPI00260C68F0